MPVGRVVDVAALLRRRGPPPLREIAAAAWRAALLAKLEAAAAAAASEQQQQPWGCSSGAGEVRSRSPPQPAAVVCGFGCDDGCGCEDDDCGDGFWYAGRRPHACAAAACGDPGAGAAAPLSTAGSLDSAWGRGDALRHDSVRSWCGGGDGGGKGFGEVGGCHDSCCSGDGGGDDAFCGVCYEAPAAAVVLRGCGHWLCAGCARGVVGAPAAGACGGGAAAAATAAPTCPFCRAAITGFEPAAPRLW